MVNAVSSTNLMQNPVTPSPANNSARPQAPQPQPPDTVQLSAAARRAISGDVDHDGDSR